MGRTLNLDGFEIMKILFVEDHLTFGQEISDLLRDFTPKMHVDLCPSESSAKRAIAHGFYDVIILDLSIPTEDEGMDVAPSHGQAVFYEAKRCCPGTPIFILTGSDMDSFSKSLARHGEQVDLWGSGSSTHTLAYYEKESADGLFEDVKKIAHQIAAVESIVLNYRGRNLALTEGEKRCLRVAVRRLGGVSADVSPLGGLSRVRVVQLIVQDLAGQVATTVVAKLGSIEDIELELKGYHAHGKRLPMGFVPPLVESVEKGACGSAGAFYSLAAGFNRSVFEVLSESDLSAANVVEKVRQGVGVWTGASSLETISIAEVRRRILWDKDFESIIEKHGLDVTQVEQRVVQVKVCCIHGDLHGANVLVDQADNAALIDFGDVGPGAACFDPISLELSAFFHPDAKELGLSAKVADRLHNWPERDLFEQGHPYVNFSRACREWAHDLGGGDLGVLACGYAYVLRQLKFDVIDPVITKRLLSSIIEKISAS